MANDSAIINVGGRLLINIFKQSKRIPPQFNVALKFFPNNDAFCIMSGTVPPDEVISVIDMVLCVKKVRLTPSLGLAISKSLQIKPAVYPITNEQIVVWEEPENTTLINRTVTRFSQVPGRIVVGIVSAASYNGSYTGNPFNFQRKQCNFAEVTVDSQRFPYNGFQPTYISFSDLPLGFFLFLANFLSSLGTVLRLVPDDDKLSSDLYWSTPAIINNS